MSKKFSEISFLYGLCFLVASVVFVSAAAVTIHFPHTGSIQNLNYNGVDGGNITINASVEIAGGDLNITSVNFSYRPNPSADWILISYDPSLAGNATINLTSNAGNHTYLFPWNLTGLGEGISYELNASAYNDTVLVGSTVVTGIIIDATNPTAEIEVLDPLTLNAKSSFFFGDDVLLRCTRSDATAGFNDSNMTVTIPGSSTPDFKEITTKVGGSTKEAFETTFTDTDTLGTFLVTCGIKDKAGAYNASLNATFDIIRKPPQGSTRPRGFVNPVGKKIISGEAKLGMLTAEKAISVQMRTTSLIKMDVQGTSYTFSLKSLSEDSITIAAGTEDVTISKGAAGEADLNGDGTNDVKITFHKQFKKGSSATADVTFEAIATPVQAGPTTGPSKAGSESEKTPVSASSAGSLLVTVIVIVVIIVVGYFLIKGKKK